MNGKALIYYRKAEQSLRRGDLRGAMLQLKMAIAARPAVGVAPDGAGRGRGRARQGVSMPVAPAAACNPLHLQGSRAMVAAHGPGWTACPPCVQLQAPRASRALRTSPRYRPCPRGRQQELRSPATGCGTPITSSRTPSCARRSTSSSAARTRSHADAIAAGTREPLKESTPEFIVKASGINKRYVQDKTGLLDPERMCPNIQDRPEDELSIQAEYAVNAAKRALARAGRARRGRRSRRARLLESAAPVSGDRDRGPGRDRRARLRRSTSRSAARPRPARRSSPRRRSGSARRSARSSSSPS